MIDYKNELQQVKENQKILEDNIARLEDKIAFKDEMLKDRFPKQAVELRDIQIKELEKQIDRLNQK